MRLVPAFLMVCFSALLPACATTSPAQPQMIADARDCAAMDCRKMDEVERTAQFRGVAVIWVNPPQKPK